MLPPHGHCRNIYFELINSFTAVAVGRALGARHQSTFATFACDLNRERKPLPQVVLSFCAPRAAAHHLPATMRQTSLCRVRPTVGVVATHRCAPPPAARDRPARLHGRCAADRDGGTLAAAAARGQKVRASQP